jgi:hypothetical protein
MTFGRLIIEVVRLLKVVLIELFHRFRFGLQFPPVLEGSLCTSRARFQFTAGVWILRFTVQRLSSRSFDPVMECAFPTQASSWRGIMHWIRGLPGEEFRGQGFEVS